MLGLPLGANINPFIEHYPSPHLKGERIRFLLVRIEA